MPNFIVVTETTVKNTVHVEAENLGEACKKATNYIRRLPLDRQTDISFTRLEATKVDYAPIQPGYPTVR